MCPRNYNLKLVANQIESHQRSTTHFHVDVNVNVVAILGFHDAIDQIYIHLFHL